MLREPGATLNGETSALVVAGPDRPAGGLRGAWGEVGIVRTSFPRAVVLTGADATAASVLSVMAGARIVHFACHGVAVANNPMSSALLLAGDGELRLAQLAAIAMDGVDLAVQTAASDIAPPAESLNLSTGLLAAGAHTVIGSLWPVPDVPTAALMEIFYAGLAAAAPPAEALRRARLALAGGRVRAPPAAGADDWRDPYFWAAFVCMGQ